jgi:hypothetical protein
MQVLRLRVSRSAVSHFAQDDTVLGGWVLEWLERGQERGQRFVTALEGCRLYALDSFKQNGHDWKRIDYERDACDVPAEDAGDSWCV